MTADEKLTRIRVKIKRAEKHFEDFKTARQRFLNPEPYAYVFDDKPETGDVEIRMTRLDSVPDDVIPPIVGDIVHNLRSALDHVAYQLVFVGTGGKGISTNKRGPFAHVYFPTARSAQDYIISHAGKVDGMADKAKDAIAATEPYQGGKGHYLWVLNELDIADKHHALLTGISSLTQVSTSYPTPTRVKKPGFYGQIVRFGRLDMPGYRRLLKAGDIVATFKREDFENVKPTFDVAFGEPEVVKGKSILETLKYVIPLVDKTIIGLKPWLA